MSEYIIQSAYYAAEDNSAAMIQTSDFGAVIVNKPDRPALWEKVMEWAKAGGTIAPFVPSSGAPDVD